MTPSELRKYVLYLALTPVYVLSMAVPRRDDLWVFGAAGGSSFSGNPKYVFLHAHETADDIEVVWISADAETVRTLQSRGYPAYHRGTIRAKYVSLRAGCAIVSHGIQDLVWWGVGGATVVQLWHGVSFKKKRWISEMERERLNPVETYFLRYVLWRCDYVAVTSSELIEMHAEAFDVSTDDVLVTGYPRHDALFEDRDGFDIGVDDDPYDGVRAAAQSETVVMYLPTYRDTDRDPLAEGDLATGELDRALGRLDARMYVKLHPFTESDVDVHGYDRITLIEGDFDIYPVMRYVDVLVTDYSSVFSDFLLLDRPQVFYPYDFDRYVADDRDLYFDYRSHTPGPIVDDRAGFLDTLADLADGVDEHGDVRAELRAFFFDHVDGESSRRVFETIKRLTGDRSSGGSDGN